MRGEELGRVTDNPVADMGVGVGADAIAAIATDPDAIDADDAKVGVDDEWVMTGGNDNDAPAGSILIGCRLPPLPPSSLNARPPGTPVG